MTTKSIYPMQVSDSNNNNWYAIDIDNQVCGRIGEIELECDNGEYFLTTVVQCGEYLVFGGVTNTGLLQDGFFKMDLDFSLDENLQALIEDIESALSEGVGYQSEAFQVNARFYDESNGSVYL